MSEYGITKTVLVTGKLDEWLSYVAEAVSGNDRPQLRNENG